MNTKTIRYYESIGLLPQPPRIDTGYRIYGGEDEARLVFIRTAQHLGLSLEEIREVLRLRDQGTAPCDHVRGALREQIRTVSRRMAELRRLRDELRALEAVIDEIPEDQTSIWRIIQHSRATQEDIAR